MKQYHILKDFDGSQNGHDFHKFQAGTTAGLSDSLAAIALQAGWAKEQTGEHPLKEIVVEATGLEGPVPEGKLDEVNEIQGNDKPALAEDRETKVEAPEETKPAKAAEKKSGKK